MKKTSRKNLFIGFVLVLLAGVASAASPVVDSQGTPVGSGTDKVVVSTES